MNRLLLVTFLITKMTFAQNDGSIKTLTGHTNPIVDIVYSPDGKTLTTLDMYQNFHVWDIEKGTVQINTLESVAIVAAISPGGKYALGHSSDSNYTWHINIYELPKFNQIIDCEIPSKTHMLFKAFFTKDNTAAFVSGVESDGNRSFYIIDIAQPQNNKLVLNSIGATTGFRSHEIFTITPDNSLLVSDYEGGGLNLRQKDGTLVKELSINNTVTALAISSDSKYIVWGSKDSTVKVWNIRTDQCIKTLIGHNNKICAVAISPDGSIIASGSGNENSGEIILWNIKTGKKMKTYKCTNPTSITFSPDGKTIASAGGANGYQIKLWNVY